MSDKYTHLLKRLLPPGHAWVAQPGSNLHRLIAGLAVELQRVEDRAKDLAVEAFPPTASELLGEWEEMFGLPECTPAPTVESERQAALEAKLKALAGQDATLSEAFFISVAEALGYTVTIERQRPFRVGQNACGDALWGDDFVFAWKVVGASGANDDLLRCTIEALAPPFTTVTFELT
jgi:uncharacterized protein YmfQ (DUF2313 family)